MIKKIDVNKYGVVRYAISSIEDIADLPREVSVGSEAILVNEDGEKKFRLGSDGWVEVVEVKEYDEDKLRDILEDAKVGYGGIEYETLEERLDKDFDNVYSVLDNRTYVEYEGCRITAKDSLNGLQKETVIKGRTLQNLTKGELAYILGMSGGNRIGREIIGNFVKYTTVENGSSYITCKLTNSLSFIKPSTNYTIIFTILENTIPNYKGITIAGASDPFYLTATNRIVHAQSFDLNVGTKVIKFTTDSDISGYTGLGFGFPNINSGVEAGKVFYIGNVILLEGDYTQTPLEELPFIEGIESVGESELTDDGYKISGKSCGKNLIDISKLSFTNQYIQTGVGANIYSYAGGSSITRLTCDNVISVKPSTNYVVTCDSKYRIAIVIADKNSLITRTFVTWVNPIRFTTTAEENKIKFTLRREDGSEFNDNDEKLLNIQIEENLQATPYEPYKESTYSYILDEPLRSLPDGVCDEIDLEKGVVTRRVGRVVLDGTNGSFDNIPSISNTLTNCMCFGIPSANWDKPMIPTPTCNTSIVSNIPYIVNNTDVFHWRGSNSIVDGVNYGVFILFIEKTKLTTLDSTGVNEWLSKNNIEIVYQLLTPTTEYLIKDDKFVTLPNGVKDEISHNSVLRKVGKIVLDGSVQIDNFILVKGDTIGFTIIPYIYFKKVKLDIAPNIVNNIGLTVSSHNAFANYDTECISLTSDRYEGYNIFVRVSASKLTSPDINGFREWLTLNPITVWYESEESYTEPIDLNEVILDTTRLKSYEPITHITSDNYLLPTIKTQVPSDFNAVVLGLKNNNESLASQVMSLRQTNDELEATNREQDDVIDVTLLALDEVYGMIDEGEIEAMSVGSPMVNVYVKMIKRGIKTLDEVPAKYRAEVEELI